VSSKAKKVRINNVLAPENRYPLDLSLDANTVGYVNVSIEIDPDILYSVSGIFQLMEKTLIRLIIVVCQNKKVLAINSVSSWAVFCHIAREGNYAEDFIATFLSDLRKEGWTIPDHIVQH
jgi:hypothetical protein